MCVCVCAHMYEDVVVCFTWAESSGGEDEEEEEEEEGEEGGTEVKDTEV